jgi:hypothetical protein
MVPAVPQDGSEPRARERRASSGLHPRSSRGDLQRKQGGGHYNVTADRLIMVRRDARLNRSRSRWWGSVQHRFNCPRWWSQEAKLPLEQHQIEAPTHGCVPLQEEAYRGSVQLRRCWRRATQLRGGCRPSSDAPQRVTSPLGVEPDAVEPRGMTAEEPSALWRNTRRGR